MSRRRHAPNPPVYGALARLTLADIEAARSPRGGWTRETFHGWGIPWPPEAGWKEKLTGIPAEPKTRGPMVTIITDASFCMHSRAAGYAGWIKGDGPAQWVSGAVPGTPSGAAEAELIGMQRALRAGVDQGIITDGASVTLKTDCIGALSAIAFVVPSAEISQGEEHSVTFTRAKRLTPAFRNSDELRDIEVLARAHRLRLILRHVKGHVTVAAGNGSTSVNRQCDRMAKEAMHERRGEIYRERGAA